MLGPLLVRPRVAQAVKWTVYLSLLINFGIYFRDDFLAMQASIPPGSPFRAYLETFSTTIDMAAWMMLVLVFELETYQLPNEAFTKWVNRAFLGTRVLCYALIVVAAYGYYAEAAEYYDAVPGAPAGTLCEHADQDRYVLVDIINYEPITSANCGPLETGDDWLEIPGESALIASSTVETNKWFGAIDVLNAVVWILVVILIEVQIWLQTAERFGGRALGAASQGLTLLYLILIGNCLIWLWHDYYVYAWDAFLWIAGFWAIELNLAEWEQDHFRDAEAAASG